MLRLLVLLLLLANAAYFAWSQGLLGAWGWAPAAQTEPERLARQIRPEALRVLGADEAQRRVSVAELPPAGAECLQAGLYEEAQAAALRRVLEARLPAGSWSLEPVPVPGRFMIYMGKYPDNEALARKKAELRFRNVPYTDIASGPLEPGLSLGSFDSQDDAVRRLEALADRGVRTARVVQERPEGRGLRLVLPAVDNALRPRLDEIRDQLAGKALQACS